MTFPSISLWGHIKGELIGQWLGATFQSPWPRENKRYRCHKCGKTERATGESLIPLYDDGIIYECHRHGTPDRMVVTDCFTNQRVSLEKERHIIVQAWLNIIDDCGYWLSGVWRFIIHAPRHWALFWLRAISYYSRKLADALTRDYR